MYAGWNGGRLLWSLVEPVMPPIFVKFAIAFVGIESAVYCGIFDDAAVESWSASLSGWVRGDVPVYLFLVPSAALLKSLSTREHTN